MGEKTAILACGQLGDKSIEIELNSPPAENLEEQIHIQTPRFRLEMSLSRYLELACATLVADAALSKLKQPK